MTDQDYQSLMIKFQDYENDLYAVEYCKKSKDFIYHFYPPLKKDTFNQDFGVYLEKAFKDCLPEDADVRADFMSLVEAQLILRHGDEKGEIPPTESFYVCVKDMADNPMAESILTEKIFLKLNSEIENGRSLL